MALAASVCLTGISHGQLISVNFTGGTPSVEGNLVGPGGGLATTWNQFAGPTSPGALVDSTGAASTVVISTNFDLPNTYDGGVINLKILQGSMTNFGKGADNTGVTIGGLAAGTRYDIWLLTLRNQPFANGTPQGTEQYVGWWSTANTTTSSRDQFVDARGAAINTSTFVQGYNYVLFENVVANGSGNIVFSGVAGPLLNGSDNNFRLGLNGLQIKNSAPVIVGPVDNSMSTVDSSPSNVFANGVSTSTVTVALKDASGQRISNKNVTLANTSGPQAAIISPLTALTTNAAGEVTFSVRSNMPGIEVFSATVVADSLTLTDTASVEFTSSAVPLAYNVNFHAGAIASGLLGVVGAPGETWNQGTTSVSNLLDSTGTVSSSVSVSGLPDGGSTVNAALNVFDANRNFFGKGADTTVSITGLLPDTAYDLYIYALSHNTGSWGEITDTERAAGDFVTSNAVLGNGQSQFLDNGIAGTNDSAFVPNGNYVVFQSIVSNGSGNISILADAYDGADNNSSTGDGDCRLHISGLQIRPASGISVDYGAWRSGSYPSLGLPGADDDGDGLTNDYERIFGLDPRNPASANPYAVPFDRATGSFSYSRRSPSLANLTYKLWYSTDLAQWFQDNGAYQTIQSATNNVEIVGVKVDPALLSQPKLFIQMRATQVTGVDPVPALVNLWGSGNTITLLFSEPMSSAAANPQNYTVTQGGAGTLNITGASLSSDGGSVTLTLASPLGLATGYSVSVAGVTSGTGQSLASESRQFKTWDNNPNGIKVFILAGQSNMVGYGNVETGNTGAGAIGSLRYLAVNDASFPDYDYASLLTDPNNTASAFRNRLDVKVWWRNGGDGNLGGAIGKGDLGPPYRGADTTRIGPEFGFGQVIGDFYPSDDVLLIKCAWGGRDLAEKFRGPSAVSKRGGRVGDFFSATINQSREVLDNLSAQFPEWSGRGYEIVGFAWHQGFNDRISESFSAEYKDNLPDLISDVRTVFNKPALPFVIASTGMDIGPAEAPPYTGYSAVEKAQLWVAGVARPAKVLSTDTRPFWRPGSQSPVTSGQGFHWNHNAESQFLIGKALGDNMVDLLSP